MVEVEVTTQHEYELLSSIALALGEALITQLMTHEIDVMAAMPISTVGGRITAACLAWRNAHEDADAGH